MPGSHSILQLFVLLIVGLLGLSWDGLSGYYKNTTITTTTTTSNFSIFKYPYQISNHGL